MTDSENGYKNKSIINCPTERNFLSVGQYFLQKRLNFGKKVSICILKDNRGEATLHNRIIKEIARCLLPDIIAYCESEEGKAAFAKWKEEQANLKETENTEKSKVD